MSDGRPLRFLLLTLGGWTAFRVVALWPVAAPEAPRGPDRVAVTGTIPSTQAIGDAGSTMPGVLAIPVPPPPPKRSPPQPFVSAVIAKVAQPLSAPGQSSGQAPPRSLPPPFVPPSLAIAPDPRPSRWAASVFGIVRGGARAPLLGGQLGGSQAGARATYLLDPRHRIAIAARAATALETRGREVGLGLDWQPLRLPLHLIAEQRIGLDGYRGGPSLSVVGGIGPVEVAPRVRIEGYGQAGGIARGRVEGFADGSLRAAYRLAGAERPRRAIWLDLGLGAWGGAQRGAARLDVGPSLGLVAPAGGTAVRLTLDWRQRVAGDAAPGSGPALSIGGDF